MTSLRALIATWLGSSRGGGQLNRFAMELIVKRFEQP